jgi:hypothetical protein
MARSDEGMSSTTKVVLAVLGVGGVLLLVCCGGLAWWGNRVVQDFKKTFEESIAEMEEMDEIYAEDPARIAELAASIVDIQVPPRYVPYLGEDHTSTDVLRKQVTYSSSDDLGGVVIREMLQGDITTREEATRILAGELTEEGMVYEFEPESSSQRAFTINGEECMFEFRAGKDPDGGDDMRQAAGAVPSGGGLAYLLVYDTAPNWDEAAIVAMIESISIGKPRPGVESLPAVPGPDAVVPTETPSDSPAAIPPGETSATPAGTSEAPQ